MSFHYLILGNYSAACTISKLSEKIEQNKLNCDSEQLETISLKYWEILPYCKKLLYKIHQ